MAHTIIGIDIGGLYTKVIEIESKVNVKMLNAFMFKTPYIHTGIDRIELDKDNFLKQIANNIPLVRLRTARISINLPPSSSTVINLLMPKMAKDELGLAAINEAKRKMIPAYNPNHIFEYCLLGERIVAKIPRNEVMVIRTEKTIVQKIIGLFKEVDNVPVLITLSCCALVKVLPQEFWKNDFSIALLDIGSDNINISIGRQAKLFFMRSVPYGLHSISEDMSRQLGILEDETVKVIEEKGIPEVDFDPADRVKVVEEIMRQKYEANLRAGSTGQPQEINPLELRLLWQSYIDRVIQELRRSLAFYKEQSEGKRVEQIYFLGGGAKIRNLVNLLSSQIGGECQILLPFSRIEYRLDERIDNETISNPFFVNAASLALCVLERDKLKSAINFLPLELKRKEAVFRRRLALRIAGIIPIILFILASLQVILASFIIKTNISQTEFELNRIQKINEKLSYISDEENKFRKRSTQVEDILKQRKDPFRLLKDIAKISPEEILLAKFTIPKSKSSLEGQTQGLATQNVPALDTKAQNAQVSSQGRYQIEIEAQILATYEMANKIIEEFKNRLNSLGYFSNLNIKPLELEKISGKHLTETEDVTAVKIRKFTLTAQV